MDVFGIGKLRAERLCRAQDCFLVDPAALVSKLSLEDVYLLIRGYPANLMPIKAGGEITVPRIDPSASGSSGAIHR